MHRYGYGGMLESLKKNDFSRFRDSVYVDYTGWRGRLR